MSFIQKMESAYLQFLRIVFLIFATGAIVVAGMLGMKYLINHDSEPQKINEEVSLKIDGYHPKRAETESAPDNSTDGKAQTEDALLTEFKEAINKLGKKASPDFKANPDAVARFFNELEGDGQLGRPFIRQFNGVLSAAENRTDITAKLKQNFGSEFGALIEYAKEEYRRQNAEIETKKEQALTEALSKQSDAKWSLYVAGVLFLFFVGLVLLIVLLKIERNLRSGAAMSAPPLA